jgi:hypothetical protein
MNYLISLSIVGALWYGAIVGLMFPNKTVDSAKYSTIIGDRELPQPRFEIAGEDTLIGYLVSSRWYCPAPKDRYYGYCLSRKDTLSPDYYVDVREWESEYKKFEGSDYFLVDTIYVPRIFTTYKGRRFRVVVYEQK